MKSFFLSAVCLLFISVVSYAGTNPADSTFKEYAGKYTFPAGSPVDEVEIILGDTALTINSTQGSAIMTKLGIDSFSMSYADGIVVFKRDENKQVNKIIIYVQGIILDGDKQKPVATSRRRQLLLGKKEELA